MKVTMSQISALPYKTRDVSTQTAIEERKQEAKSITISPAVKVDISTQTEELNAINSKEEEIMPTPNLFFNDQNSTKETARVRMQKASNEFLEDIRRKERMDLLNAQRNINGNTQILSGPEHVRPSMDQEPLSSDKSFLQKCRDYLSKVYPEELLSSDFYSGIAGTLRYPIVNGNQGFNVERFAMLIKNIFNKVAYGDFNDITQREVKENLALQVAGIYKVCVEEKDIQDFMKLQNATTFTDFSLLKFTIQKYLVEITNSEVAAEVFDILDHTV